MGINVNKIVVIWALFFVNYMKIGDSLLPLFFFSLYTYFTWSGAKTLGTRNSQCFVPLSFILTILEVGPQWIRTIILVMIIMVIVFCYPKKDSCKITFPQKSRVIHCAPVLGQSESVTRAQWITLKKVLWIMYFLSTLH